jgi:hypothetical protein
VDGSAGEQEWEEGRGVLADTLIVHDEVVGDLTQHIPGEVRERPRRCRCLRPGRRRIGVGGDSGGHLGRRMMDGGGNAGNRSVGSGQC